MTSNQQPTFRTASTGEEVAEAVAIDCWYQDRDGADCPPEMVPALRDLADHLEELSGTLGAVELSHFDISEGPGEGHWCWAWSPSISEEKAAAGRRRLEEDLDRAREGGHEELALITQEFLDELDRHGGGGQPLLPTG